MLAYAPKESHPLVDAFFADQLRGENLPDQSIHGLDPMFRFAMDQRSGQRDLALVDYFQGGWSVARLVRRALVWRFGPGARPRLLDFAAGFGRATRYLAVDHDPSRVWASDVLPPAVPFLRRTFGVHAFAASSRPEELVCDQRFDAIVAASLFSHLPRATFVPWLRRLYGLLAPGGVVILSVHDQQAWPGPLDAAGHAFLEVSEIDELPTAEYGMSRVSEAFMARSIAEVSGGEASYRRLPRGLWSYQDVYLVTPDRGAADAGPFPSGEPLGHLYGARYPGENGRRLRLHGWAADLHGPGVERVEMTIDGEPAGVAAPGARLPEIAAELGRPELPVVGWEIESESRGLDPRAVVLIKVVSGSGESFVVRADTLRGLLVAEALARLKDRTDRVKELEARLDHMRRSRFWKLRDAWWELRRRLGIGRAGRYREP